MINLICYFIKSMRIVGKGRSMQKAWVAILMIHIEGWIDHFNSKRGWKIDNFESVARHEGNRYFVISDDNENPIQKTLLLYFEIISDGPASVDLAQDVSTLPTSRLGL